MYNGKWKAFQISKINKMRVGINKNILSSERSYGSNPPPPPHQTTHLDLTGKLRYIILPFNAKECVPYMKTDALHLMIYSIQYIHDVHLHVHMCRRRNWFLSLQKKKKQKNIHTSSQAPWKSNVPERERQIFWNTSGRLCQPIISYTRTSSLRSPRHKTTVMTFLILLYHPCTQ